MSPMSTLNSSQRHHRRPPFSLASSLQWPTKTAISTISPIRILTTCRKSMLKTIRDQVQSSSILNRVLRWSVPKLAQMARVKINRKGPNLKLTMTRNKLEPSRQALTASTKSSYRRLKSWLRVTALSAVLEACLLRR